MRQAAWYFDFISPFAYLQLARFGELPGDLEVEIKPVLFAGLLQHWGQLGPAELPSKRTFVYRFFKWHADRRGVPFKMPPSHPFNPLHVLRLAIAAGSDGHSVRTIFHHIYGEGNQPDEPDSIARLAEKLGMADFAERIGGEDVKSHLKRNTQEAIAAGVFGVPTFVCNGEVFWGDDATDMFLDYLANPGLFATDEMQRISTMPMGIVRRRD
jgi:2-hydroxychromene-2-carboxylate isomerase